MSNWINLFEAPYADENEKLNAFVDNVLQRVSWTLFDNQEKVIYRPDETESGIPKLREGAIDYIRLTARDELNWLISYIVDRILVAYLKGNIEPSKEVAWRFEDALDEEDIVEFWKEIDDYIWDDYAGMLGEKKTAELWKQWGKAPREEN